MCIRLTIEHQSTKSQDSLLELKEETDKSTIQLETSTPLSKTDRITRYNISKEIGLKNTTDKENQFLEKHKLPQLN